MGNEEDIIWDNLLSGRIGTLNRKVDYASPLSRKVIRRINRFSDISATAAIDCYNKLEAGTGEIDKNRVGCIFSTEFGPLETNLEFAQQIVGDDPDACSPILFSNTVHNACLGTISIDLGITGPSTMLLGSNHLMLSELLLKENKADVILSGCVDEYNQELSESLLYRGCVSQEFGEAAVVLGLEVDGKEGGKVRISNMTTLHLGSNPFENHEVEKKLLENAVRNHIKLYDVDAVIINDPLWKIGQAEKAMIRKECPASALIDCFYDYFGNCLGADLGLKILLAKMILEREMIPVPLCSAGAAHGSIGKIAVISANITGNYTIAILER